MCGGGPPPGTSCDSTALTIPPVSRPWMRMTIGMPRTFIFLPPSDGIWIGFINIGRDVLPSCADWQESIKEGCWTPGMFLVVWDWSQVERSANHIPVEN